MASKGQGLKDWVKSIIQSAFWVCFFLVTCSFTVFAQVNESCTKEGQPVPCNTYIIFFGDSVQNVGDQIQKIRDNFKFSFSLDFIWARFDTVAKGFIADLSVEDKNNLEKAKDQFGIQDIVDDVEFDLDVVPPIAPSPSTTSPTELGKFKPQPKQKNKEEWAPLCVVVQKTRYCSSVRVPKVAKEEKAGEEGQEKAKHQQKTTIRYQTQATTPSQITPKFLQRIYHLNDGQTLGEVLGKDPKTKVIKEQIESMAVAGIIGAKDNDAYTVGVAPGVKLVSVRVFSPPLQQFIETKKDRLGHPTEDCFPGTTPTKERGVPECLLTYESSFGSEILSADWIVKNKAKYNIVAVNASFRAGDRNIKFPFVSEINRILISLTRSESAYQRLIKDQGIVVVAAAGNDGIKVGKEAGKIFISPALFDGVISVMGFEDSDGKACPSPGTPRNDFITTRTNYANENILDFVAHYNCEKARTASKGNGVCEKLGDAIMTTCITKDGRAIECPFAGTSAATPIVTGAVIVYFAKMATFPNIFRPANFNRSEVLRDKSQVNSLKSLAFPWMSSQGYVNERRDCENCSSQGTVGNPPPLINLEWAKDQFTRITADCNLECDARCQGSSAASDCKPLCLQQCQQDCHDPEKCYNIIQRKEQDQCR